MKYIPVVAGSELNDDPLNPISRFAKDLIAEMGDDTPVEWLHRSERYVENLATPDVSVADLIGDVDPIKAATLKMAYSDERVIHFGLVPRAHRSIFVINELPDLQARIQVSLFNILQEGDIQDSRFQTALAARHPIHVYGQPGRLYQPGQHHHPAERPHRKSDPDPLPQDHRDCPQHYPARGQVDCRSAQPDCGA